MDQVLCRRVPWLSRILFESHHKNTANILLNYCQSTLCLETHHCKEPILLTRTGGRQLLKVHAIQESSCQPLQANVDPTCNPNRLQMALGLEPNGLVLQSAYNLDVQRENRDLRSSLRHNLTFTHAKAKKLESAPPSLPDNFESMLLILRRYFKFLFKVLGPICSLALQV